MTEERNHATIRDYIRTLRRRKWVILGVVVIAALAAGAISLSQSKTYTAQASLRALDISQSTGFGDILQSNQSLPTETSAQLAQTSTRPEVIAEIKSTLGLTDSVDTIRSRLSTSEDQQSNFVIMSATARTAGGAASLANAAATAVAGVSNREVRNQFAGIAAQDRQQAANLLAAFAGKPYAKLPPQQQAQAQASIQESNQLAQLAARVLAFSRAVSVARVSSVATPPSSPSSPHPVSTILLGAIVGLVIALLLVWFLESLDRRVRRPDEAESILGIQIVGALPKGALGQSPGQSGDAVSIASFRMLRTNMRFLAARAGAEAPRSMLVTSAVAGEGKTTVSFGVALAAAASGLNALLIEADVHRPTHAERLGLDPDRGLVDYLKGNLSPQEILQTYTFADPSLWSDGKAPNGNASKLACITAGSVGSLGGSELSSQRFADVLSEVTKVYDLVVIDTAPLLAVAETSDLLAMADMVALCVRLGKTTVEQTRAARSALERLPQRPTGLMVTDLEAEAGGYYGYTYAHDYTPTAASKAAG
jgi:Mrp family chromosome partitioning ATPase